MTKIKKPIFKYGIELVKPWSKEMYDHNEKVTAEMKSNILELINNRYDGKGLEELNELTRHICWCSLDLDSYDLDETLKELIQGLDDLAPYQLHSDYDYLVDEFGIDKVEIGYVGYESRKEKENLLNNQSDANTVSFAK